MDETETSGLVVEPDNNSNSPELVTDVQDHSDITPNIRVSAAPCESAEAKNCTEQNKTVSKDLENSNKLESSELNQPEDTVLVVKNSVACKLLNDEHPQEISNQNLNKSSRDDESSDVAVVISSKPLCADYRSGSDSECDSESDSSTSTSTSTGSLSDSDSDGSLDSSGIANTLGKGKKRITGDLSFNDLPPIENLKISVPEDACVEIGTITSVVDVLVIVESYKGTAALDVDTVLFLERGKKTLGKVFDILGPITEPVYAVRFNTPEQIKNLNIKKDMKVHCAPKTEHTCFVFMSEVLRNKGSDASWKDNIEAPPEFQDFSDDEEERLHKNKNVRDSGGNNVDPKEQSKSRKRPFKKTNQNNGVLQAMRFRNPDLTQQSANFQRNPSAQELRPLRTRFGTPPYFARPNFHNPHQIPQFPYCAPSSTFPPQYRFIPRFSGPPFPTFGGLPHLNQNQNQNFQQLFYQQRTHAFPQGFGPWAPPPPPPPPPSEQGVRRPAPDTERPPP